MQISDLVIDLFSKFQYTRPINGVRQAILCRFMIRLEAVFRSIHNVHDIMK